MPSLTVRDIPESVMKRLRQAARQDRRSTNAQAIEWLGQAARRWVGRKERARLLMEVEALRLAISRRGRPLGDSATTIRQMRDRRGQAKR